MSKNLITNEWILINDIIYNINSIENITKIQKTILKLISVLIPNSASCFFLSDDSKKGLLSHPVGIGLTNEDLNDYIENGQDMDYVKGIMICGKSVVYNETDYFSDTQRETTEYYQRYYAPKNFHYCVQVTFSHYNLFLGVLSLYRPRKDGDFTEKDLFILELLKDHISLRLYNDEIKNNQKPDLELNKFDLNTFVDKFDLTKRETEVIKLMKNNYTNEEISEILTISIHTLKKHILNIYKKANVTSRVQLLKLFLYDTQTK